MSLEQEPPYDPKDAISASLRSTVITGGAGTLISAVQNTLTKQNVGAWGIFTRTGGTIAVYGMSDGYASSRIHQADQLSRDGWDIRVRQDGLS